MALQPPSPYDLKNPTTAPRPRPRRRAVSLTLEYPDPWVSPPDAAPDDLLSPHMRAASGREEEGRKARLAAEVAAEREEGRKRRKAKKEAQLAKLLAARERAEAERPYDIFWESSNILAEEGREVDQEEQGI
jgi:hypothetical protein